MAGLDVYYRGAYLAPSPTSSCFSILGIIFLKEDQLTDMEWAVITLKHEYGHIEQERRLGTIKYLIIVGIPSLVSYELSQHWDYIEDNYFNLTVERGADYYGGVAENERGHSWLSDIDWFFFKLLVLHDFS